MAEHLFGTDGIRGRIGVYPFLPTDLMRIGKALALWAHRRYGSAPRILLGHDTRTSCHWVKAALESGLLLYPVTLHDAGVVPTPAVCHVTMHDTHNFDCAIIISASHNPHHDNGIKIIDSRQGKLPAADEITITHLFNEQSLEHSCYTHQGIVIPSYTTRAAYKNFLASFFPPDFLSSKKVVLDCANGATYTLAPEIFRHYGAEVIALHTSADGVNINNQCGALHPADVQKAVIAHRADIGFAFDGDGDRVIAVNKYGVIKNGDDILALLLQHPAYKDSPAIVGTLMTNHGFSRHLAHHHKQLLRTAVGDKYVAEQLIKENLLIGGEQSGHIILRDYLDTGDGIFTALRTLESLCHSQNWDLETFTHYPQLIINLPIAIKKDLASPELAAIIAMGNEQLQSGRVVVRYSGTENVLRIMVEDNELEHARYIGNLLSHAFHHKLSV